MSGKINSLNTPLRSGLKRGGDHIRTHEKSESILPGGRSSLWEAFSTLNLEKTLLPLVYKDSTKVPMSFQSSWVCFWASSKCLQGSKSLVNLSTRREQKDVWMCFSCTFLIMCNLVDHFLFFIFAVIKLFLDYVVSPVLFFIGCLWLAIWPRQDRQGRTEIPGPVQRRRRSSQR